MDHCTLYTPLIKLRSLQVRLRDLFSESLGMKEVQRTSLTLLHDKGFASLDSDLTLNPMEIYSFKVKWWFEVKWWCKVKCWYKHSNYVRTHFCCIEMIGKKNAIVEFLWFTASSIFGEREREREREREIRERERTKGSLSFDNIYKNWLIMGTLWCLVTLNVDMLAKSFTYYQDKSWIF